MGTIKEKRLLVKSITNETIELDLGGGSSIDFPLMRLIEEMDVTPIDHLIKNLGISLAIQGVDVNGDKLVLKKAIEDSTFKVVE